MMSGSRLIMHALWRTYLYHNVSTSNGIVVLVPQYNAVQKRILWAFYDLILATIILELKWLRLHIVNYSKLFIQRIQLLT